MENVECATNLNVGIDAIDIFWNCRCIKARDGVVVDIVHSDSIWGIITAEKENGALVISSDHIGCGGWEKVGVIGWTHPRGSCTGDETPQQRRHVSMSETRKSDFRQDALAL